MRFYNVDSLRFPSCNSYIIIEVLIAVRDALVRSCCRVPVLEVDGENVWLRLESGGMVLFICIVYFPPSSTSIQTSSFFQAMLAGANLLKCGNILVLGDFNVPSLHFIKCDIEFVFIL